MKLLLLMAAFSFFITSIFPQEPASTEQIAKQQMLFNFVYPGFLTGWDLQSIGTPQQVWQDPDNPMNVHAVFQQSSDWWWTDRNGRYLFSSDMGQTWDDSGQVSGIPPAGYPSISGLGDGRPIVGIQTHESIATEIRTQIYIRNSQNTGWLRFDPGTTVLGEPLYPQVHGFGSDRVFFGSSINGICMNTLDVTAGSFSGWNCYADSGSVYQFAVSDDLVIGFVYTGSLLDSVLFGDLYYSESIDGGLSWDDPIEIYKYGWGGDSLGAFKGVDIIFLENVPYVVFETAKQDFSSSSYFPSAPNKIMLWSPELNNGVSFPIAESGINIPYYHNYTNENLLPVCRPAIGKSVEGNALFVVMNAVTEFYLDWGIGPSSYFAGYITYSLDGGLNWSTPEKFTPETPLRDWKYINISPTNAVSVGDCHLQMTAQADTLPGWNLYPPWGVWAASAEFVGITASVSLVSVNDNKEIPEDFSLSQNYPNPFNPSTRIQYNLKNEGYVKLLIYDIKGELLSTLVNEEQQSGKHEVDFTLPGNISTGVYIYRLTVTDNNSTPIFSDVKKMIYLK